MGLGQGGKNKLVQILDSELKGSKEIAQLLVSHRFQAWACLLLDLLLNLLLLPHHFAQFFLILLQIILYLVHPLLVLLNLLVLRGQFLVELLDLYFIMVQLKELQLHLGSYHLILQALVAVRLCKQE